MKKRTIFIVLACILATVFLIIFFNWITVRNTLVQALKKQIRKDFLAQLIPNEDQTTPQPTFQDKFSFAVISDVHNNTKGLDRAIAQINSSQSQFVIGLGDYTNVGTEKEFSAIHKSLSSLAKKYYLLPGDHDLWNGRDKLAEPDFYFRQTFASQPENFTYKDVRFIFLDNADLYEGVSDEAKEKFRSELNSATESTIIILSHKAIYHPLTIHSMGYINDVKNVKVSAQAEEILQEIKAKKDKNIILLSGDLHSFSKYSTPADNYDAYTIGALTEEKNFQTPRYAIVHISAQNQVQVEDKPL